MTAYLPILTMICLVVVFIAASFTVSQLLGPRRPTAAKQAPYESGIVPEQEPSERFPVKFYLVAMTFIVLDVEIIFLYPFTTIFRNSTRRAWARHHGRVRSRCSCRWYLLSTGALDWARRTSSSTVHGVPRADGLDLNAQKPDRQQAA
jgi:NADH-quinone oxidoreductase subunit A